MAQNERKEFTRLMFARLSKDVAERIAANQSKYPDREIICVWLDENGMITRKATRNPYLLAINRVPTNLLCDMQTATDVIIEKAAAVPKRRQ